MVRKLTSRERYPKFVKAISRPVHTPLATTGEIRGSGLCGGSWEGVISNNVFVLFEVDEGGEINKYVDLLGAQQVSFLAVVKGSLRV